MGWDRMGWDGIGWDGMGYMNEHDNVFNAISTLYTSIPLALR
jgi:hypothetical protein